jgi:hypothetical protein
MQLNNKCKLFFTEAITGEGVYEDASYFRVTKVAGSAVGSPNLNGIEVGFSEDARCSEWKLS